MQIAEKANVTKRILGTLPYKYEDFTTNTIKVDKISEEIKPVDKGQLRS